MSGVWIRALASALVLALAGCGLGAGPASEGTATLTVTRDYGAERLVDASATDPPGSETVMRLLDREAEVTTRYGGGFVQSIEGLSGMLDGGRSFDWFFYVNGVESAIGATDARVRGGDRIWWDYRDWTDAMRVPAVVGSWPEPFAQASAGSDRMPVTVECATVRPVCDEVADRLAGAGVSSSVEPLPDRGGGATTDAGEADALRVLVGAWQRVRADGAAALLDDGPAGSGVFARFDAGSTGWTLEALDERAEVATRLGPGTGLVAAVREGEAPPAWIVTGTDAAGVEAAVELLADDSLRDRYAVAVEDGRELALPVVEGE